MNKSQIKAYIAYKKFNKSNLHELWNSINHLNITIGLSTSTMDELQAKISSKIAQCEISIRDHEKLLSENP